MSVCCRFFSYAFFISQRPECVLRLLKADRERKCQTMVFTNNTENCSWFGRFLSENDFPNEQLYGELPQVLRRGRFAQFRDGKVPVLVCTDIASRGLVSSSFCFGVLIGMKSSPRGPYIFTLLKSKTLPAVF